VELPHRENRVRGELVPIRVRMVRNHLLYEGTGSLVSWILEVGQEIIHGDADASAKLLTKPLSRNCCSRGRAASIVVEQDEPMSYQSLGRRLSRAGAALANRTQRGR
jgi:hypothetical protein